MPSLPVLCIFLQQVIWKKLAHQKPLPFFNTASEQRGCCLDILTQPILTQPRRSRQWPAFQIGAVEPPQMPPYNRVMLQGPFLSHIIMQVFHPDPAFAPCSLYYLITLWRRKPLGQIRQETRLISQGFSVPATHTCLIQ